SWRLHRKSYAVVTDANMLKLIEVPVSVVGEATGTVMLEKDGVRSGLGRIILNIYRDDHTPKGKVLTEHDGYFSYFGLEPGSYFIRVDTAQLRRLNLVAAPDSITFSISSSREGDYVEELDFILLTAG